MLYLSSKTDSNHTQEAIHVYASTCTLHTNGSGASANIQEVATNAGLAKLQRAILDCCDGDLDRAIRRLDKNGNQNVSVKELVMPTAVYHPA